MSAPIPTPEQWGEVKRVFLACAGMDEAARACYLAQTGAGSPEVLQAVHRLLAGEAAAPAFAADPERALGLTSPHAAPHPAISAGWLPERMGSCRVLSVLGEGAFGLVYLAEQGRPRRRVAVKVLRPGLASPGALRRLEREADIMARLRHNGIAQVFESGLDESGRPYFVMEYISGEPITAYARRMQLGIVARLRLFLLVCDGVQHAHAMGVIHRDLKPANILVTVDGQPKILDFGVARAVDPGARHATLATTLGQLVGTLAYMSPEQAAGDTQGVDIRSDVYSLGGVLHELLAGHPPLDVSGKPLQESLRLIQSAVPARLGSRVRSCRGDLETIVGKALEKDPRARYATVGELAGDIRRHLELLPIQARPPGTLYEMRRFVARHRPLVGAALIAITALLAASGWFAATCYREHQDYLVVRRLAGSWLGEAMKQLGPMSGTFETRRQMLEQVRAPLETFAARHVDDLEVRANLAALYFATAELDRETGAPNRALAGFEDSFRLFSHLAQRDPARDEWRLQESVAAVKVGDVLRGRDQIDDAITWYLAALALDFAAARDFPDIYSAQDQLVWSYDRLANLAALQGRIGDARQYCAELERAVTVVTERWPDDPRALWCRVGAMHMRAHVLSSAGRPREADLSRREAVELGRRLVRMAPANRDYASRQSFALTALAGQELEAGNTETARRLLDEASPLVERALVLDGHERTAHDAAAGLQRVRAKLLLASGRPRAAAAALGQSSCQAALAARLDPRSSEAALAAHRALRAEVDLLVSLGCLAEAQERACRLRDLMLTDLARFPDCHEMYAALASFSLEAPVPAVYDLQLARVAAERAAPLAAQGDAGAFKLLTDVLIACGDAPAARASIRRVHELAPPDNPGLQEWIISRLAALVTVPEPAGEDPH